MVEQTTTRSPGAKLRTWSPICSTMPTPSWPRMVPGSIPENDPRTKCRSVPQIADVVMRMTASVSASIVGSGTSSTRMSPRPWNTTAFMRGSPEVAEEQPEAHSPVPNLDRVLNVNLSNNNDHIIDY